MATREEREQLLMAILNQPGGRDRLLEMCRTYMAKVGKPMYVGIPLIQSILNCQDELATAS
jgi:hypothetical protein